MKYENKEIQKLNNQIIQKLKKILITKRFITINNSYIVNTKYITHIKLFKNNIQIFFLNCEKTNEKSYDDFNKLNYLTININQIANFLKDNKIWKN